MSLHRLLSRERLITLGLVGLPPIAAFGFALAASLSTAAAIGILVFLASISTVIALCRRNTMRGVVLLFAANLVITDVSIRSTEAVSSEVDLQVLLKLAIYTASFLFAAAFAWRERLNGMTVCGISYAVIVTASATWALTPTLTLGGAYILWAQLLLCLAFASHIKRLAGMTVVWKTAVWSIFAKVIGSWLVFAISPQLALLDYNPTVQGAHEWAIPRFGGFLGPNGMGLNAALMGSLALVFASRATGRVQFAYRILFLVALVTIVATQSRTALVAFFTGLVSITYFLNRQVFAVLLVVGLALGAYVSVYQRDVALDVATRGRDAESLTKLEGRTAIWSILESKIRSQPFFGYGFGSVREILPRTYVPGAFRAYYSAHNMFIESMVSVGLVGTAVLGLCLILALLRLLSGISSRDNGEDRAALLMTWAVLWILIVNGFAESGIASVQVIQSLLFFMCLVICGRRPMHLLFLRKDAAEAVAATR